MRTQAEASEVGAPTVMIKALCWARSWRVGRQGFHKFGISKLLAPCRMQLCVLNHATQESSSGTPFRVRRQVCCGLYRCYRKSGGSAQPGTWREWLQLAPPAPAVANRPNRPNSHHPHHHDHHCNSEQTTNRCQLSDACWRAAARSAPAQSSSTSPTACKLSRDVLGSRWCRLVANHHPG